MESSIDLRYRFRTSADFRAVVVICRDLSRCALAVVVICRDLSCCTFAAVDLLCVATRRRRFAMCTLAADTIKGDELGANNIIA
jgi:hypothetical protein